MNSSTTCPHCLKKYINISARNRHMRKAHSAEVQFKEKISHLYCPLCADDEKHGMTSYGVLLRHIKNIHCVNIEQEKLVFSNREDFENWMKLDYRNVDFVKDRTWNVNSKTTRSYSCNRSNTRAFKSNCTKYLKKKGGSIKINGICPSRIFADFYTNDEVSVRFTKTHVGHEKELRSRRLTPEEQIEIGEKLKAGLSLDRIVRDAQKVENGQLERINLLRKDDLKYQMKKTGIKKTKRPRSTETLELSTVEIKRWKTILDKERPNSNSCRDRQIAKAHKEAEQHNLTDSVKMIEFGKFQVTSDEHFHLVVYGGDGKCDCGNFCCRVCGICKHNYICECTEYIAKNIICKHVHMVSLYERRLPAEVVKPEELEYSCSEEGTERNLELNEAVDEYEEENIDEETYRDICCKNLVNELITLDMATFRKVYSQVKSILRQIQADTSTKSKMEEETYLPTPKKQKTK